MEWPTTCTFLTVLIEFKPSLISTLPLKLAQI
jgi:hypothetical protein